MFLAPFTLPESSNRQGVFWTAGTEGPGAEGPGAMGPGAEGPEAMGPGAAGPTEGTPGAPECMRIVSASVWAAE